VTCELSGSPRLEQSGHERDKITVETWVSFVRLIECLHREANAECAQNQRKIGSRQRQRGVGLPSRWVR
jgi:hypothetical protein